MKMTTTILALAAALAASGAIAQERQPLGSSTEPPGGAYQGYSNSREYDERNQQTAQMPATPGRRTDPGTLRKFNSNSGYGPEVQFDVDRREAAERARQQQEQWK